VVIKGVSNIEIGFYASLYLSVVAAVRVLYWVAGVSGKVIFGPLQPHKCQSSRQVQVWMCYVDVLAATIGYHFPTRSLWWYQRTVFVYAVIRPFTRFFRQSIVPSLCATNSSGTSKPIILQRVSKTVHCAKLFVTVRTSSNFHRFWYVWQKDGKEAKIIRDTLIFHLTCHHRTMLNMEFQTTQRESCYLQ